MAFVLAGLKPDMNDGEWETWLAAYGANRRIARGIVVFAPTAAARVHFRGSDVTIDFPNTYATRSSEGALQEHLLEEQPAFVATLRAAEWATADEVLAVARRSGIYKAAAALRRDGPRRLLAGQLNIPLDHLDARGEPEFSPRIGPLRKLQLWWNTRSWHR